jgi:hypothetical protein
MNNYSHICVICGNRVGRDDDCEVVEVSPPIDEVFIDMVHKECIEKIRKSVNSF